MVKKSTIKRVVKLLDDPYVMVGHVPELLEAEGITEKKDIKKVLDELHVINTKQRRWIYEQMELRKNEKLKDVI